jgi:hypothetical protein
MVVAVGSWQAQVHSSQQQGAGRGRPSGRAAEEGYRKEEEEGAPRLRVRQPPEGGREAHPRGDGPRRGAEFGGCLPLGAPGVLLR